MNWNAWRSWDITTKVGVMIWGCGSGSYRRILIKCCVETWYSIQYSLTITVYSTVIVKLYCFFRRRSKKTSKLRVTVLCAGNSPVTGEFPAQRASYAENVSIWWRHHVYNLLWCWQNDGIQCNTLVTQSIVSKYSQENPLKLPRLGARLRKRDLGARSMVFLPPAHLPPYM